MSRESLLAQLSAERAEIEKLVVFWKAQPPHVYTGRGTKDFDLTAMRLNALEAVLASIDDTIATLERKPG